MLGGVCSDGWWVTELVCGLGWGGGRGWAVGTCDALAISPVCVLVVCSRVLARCLHAVRCWAVCVAMAWGR